MTRALCCLLMFMGLLGATCGVAEEMTSNATPPASPSPMSIHPYAISTAQSGSNINWLAGQLEAVGIGYLAGAGEQAKAHAHDTALFVMRKEARRALPDIQLDASTKLASALTSNSKSADDIMTSLVIADTKVDKEQGVVVIVGVIPLFDNPHILPLAYGAVQHDPLIPAKDQLTKTLPMPKGHTPQRSYGPYTGIILNNDQAQVKPCLFPRLFRFDAVELWGPGQLTPDITAAPVRYTPNMSTALTKKLAGDTPLIIETIGNALGYYPLLNVDDVLLLHQLQEDEKVMQKLPLIFTLGK